MVTQQPMEQYLNRQEAGRVLANQLRQYKESPNTTVLALPRGGVPVAYEVAKSLSLPLDIYIVRKLGVPGHEELAFGAVASDKTIIFNDDILKILHIPNERINQIIKTEEEELQRREIIYRGNCPRPTIKERTIILIDDGIATGATIRTAIISIKQQHPARLIVAVPVAALSTNKDILSLVDEFVCPLKPMDFYAVGYWYEDFSQTSDEEVIELLGRRLG